MLPLLLVLPPLLPVLLPPLLPLLLPELPPLPELLPLLEPPLLLAFPLLLPELPPLPEVPEPDPAPELDADPDPAPELEAPLEPDPEPEVELETEPELEPELELQPLPPLVPEVPQWTRTTHAASAAAQGMAFRCLSCTGLLPWDVPTLEECLQHRKRTVPPSETLSVAVAVEKRRCPCRAIGVVSVRTQGKEPNPCSETRTQSPR